MRRWSLPVALVLLLASCGGAETQDTADVASDGDIRDIKESSSVSPGDENEAAPPTTSTATTSLEASVAALFDPCTVIEGTPEASALGLGPGTPNTLDVAGDILGFWCDWFGVGNLTIGIYHGGASSFVDRCSKCEPIDGVGEQAWIAVFANDTGRPLSEFYVESSQATITIRGDGFKITEAQLLELMDVLLAAQ